MTGTAMGFVMTYSWIGLAVSSQIIGAIAGGDPLRVRKALLLISGTAALMVGLNLAMRAMPWREVIGVRHAVCPFRRSLQANGTV